MAVDNKRSVLKLFDAANSSNCSLTHSDSGTTLASSAGQPVIIGSVLKISDGNNADINDFTTDYATFKALEASNHASHAASLTQVGNDIAQEVVRAQAAEAANAASLAAEITRASAAETALDSKIDTVESALQTDLDNKHQTQVLALNLEAGLRQQADTTLTTQIQAEETRALAAEASLQSQITNVLSGSPESLNSLSELVTAYSAADQSLSNLINSLTTRVATLEAQIAAHLSESP